MSSHLSNRLVDFLFRKQLFVPPNTFYFSLHHACGKEVAGLGYARAALEAGLENWQSTQGDSEISAGSTGQTSNTSPINFPAPGPGGWGTATDFSVWDESVGGNRLLTGELIAIKTIHQNDVVLFPAGAVKVEVK